jgi:hypothetical protein
MRIPARTLDVDTALIELAAASAIKLVFRSLRKLKSHTVSFIACNYLLCPNPKILQIWLHNLGRLNDKLSYEVRV